MSALLTFLKRGGFLVRGEVRELTHTLMDGCCGGRVALPDAAAAGFFAAYGADLRRPTRALCVVERRSAVFKLHFDVDFAELHGQAEIDAFLTLCSLVVASHFEPEGREAEGLACAVLGDDRETRQGPGLHLVFPWAHLDAAAAQAVRGALVAACAHQLPWCPDWGKALDGCVLAGSGFRMVGADKSKSCGACGDRAEARPFCAGCKGKGRVRVGKIYWPWRALGGAERLLRDARANDAHGARLCSVRLPADARVSASLLVRPPRAPPRAWTCGRLALPAESRELLLAMLRGLHAKYAQLEIQAVEQFESEETLRIRVRGPGCRFCMNKASEHSSQSVYFLVSSEGSVQRCFSRKSTLRSGGCSCPSFSSAPRPLPAELTEALAALPHKRRRTVWDDDEDEDEDDAEVRGADT